jgi:hypothetical protein
VVISGKGATISYSCNSNSFCCETNHIHFPFRLVRCSSFSTTFSAANPWLPSPWQHSTHPVLRRQHLLNHRRLQPTRSRSGSEMSRHRESEATLGHWVRPVRDSDLVNIPTNDPFTTGDYNTSASQESRDTTTTTEITPAEARLQFLHAISKWTCILCNFDNYPSSSVCFSCGMSRKQGPVGPDTLFKDLLPLGPPFAYPTWDCVFCFARKNSPWRDECWKGTKQRPPSYAEKKKRKMLKTIAE